MDTSVLLGHDTETGEPVFLNDCERCTGTLIFGMPNIGKTDALLRLTLHDIEAGRGLFFLESGAELVSELIQRTGRPFQEQLLLFDPTHDTHTFCLNPVRCPDPADVGQRVDTYNRAYPILKRLLSADLSPATPFLGKIPETPYLERLTNHIIWAFTENQEYTLADLPLFLKNQRFREHLISNMHNYHEYAVHFWKEVFSRKDNSIIIDRVTHLFTHPALRHILGGPETTIDMSRFLIEKKIILVSFSQSLDQEYKRCISCLLLGELLAALNDRTVDTWFSLYVSELLELPEHEDFNRLFFGLRGLLTTFSSSELRDESPVRSSITSAAKMLFRLTAKDAQILASEMTPNLYQEYQAYVARDLSGLPPFTAYLTTSAKIKEKKGKADRKLRILPLLKEEESVSESDRKLGHISQQAIFLQTLPYLYPRDLIEAEIRKRQEPFVSPLRIIHPPLP